MSEARTTEPADMGTQRPAAARAEATVDLAGERVGQWAATLSRRLQVLAARAREEVEDIWAEAQSEAQTLRHDIQDEAQNRGPDASPLPQDDA